MSKYTAIIEARNMDFRQRLATIAENRMARLSLQSTENKEEQSQEPILKKSSGKHFRAKTELSNNGTDERRKPAFYLERLNDRSNRIYTDNVDNHFYSRSPHNWANRELCRKVILER